MLTTSVPFCAYSSYTNVFLLSPTFVCFPVIVHVAPSPLSVTNPSPPIDTVFAVNGVVSLKRLLNQSNLKSWSSKMIKKSLEAYFFTLKNKIVFCKKQFQNMSVFCFVSTEIV